MRVVEGAGLVWKVELCVALTEAQEKKKREKLKKAFFRMLNKMSVE
jgi:hypothetical protein